MLLRIWQAAAFSGAAILLAGDLASDDTFAPRKPSSQTDAERRVRSAEQANQKRQPAASLRHGFDVDSRLLAVADSVEIRLSEHGAKELLEDQFTGEESAVRQGVLKSEQIGGLPFREAGKCRKSAAGARRMADVARSYRQVLDLMSGNSRLGRLAEGVNPIKALPRAVNPAKMNNADALATVCQMLQHQGPDYRRSMMNTLSTADDPASALLLAKRALFDSHRELRLEAIEALGNKTPEHYLPTLLDGFRYPWAPVAYHAAEALVRLDAQDALPALKKLLDAPDPEAAFKDESGQWVQRRLVRINHLSNCVLCHAPLSQQDRTLGSRVGLMVPGAVPTPGQVLPPQVSLYYNPDNLRGSFVRADVTYLRQDFSLSHPVGEPNAWPDRQRFDYLVQVRPAPPSEVAYQQRRQSRPDALNSYPQRHAVLAAIERMSAKRTE